MTGIDKAALTVSWKTGVPLAEIAESFGVSRVAISTAARRMGLQARARGGERKAWRIAEMIDGSRTIDEVAVLADATPAYVAKVARRIGASGALVAPAVAVGQILGFLKLSASQRRWLLDNTPVGATPADLIRALVVDAMIEDGAA